MAATGLLLIFAFVVGLVSFGKMQQVVTEEFNRQQLVLAENLPRFAQFARHIAPLVEMPGDVVVRQDPGIVQ